MANQAEDHSDASNVYFEASYKDVTLGGGLTVFWLEVKAAEMSFYEPLADADIEVCFDSESYAGVGSFAALINRVSTG